MVTLMLKLIAFEHANALKPCRDLFRMKAKSASKTYSKFISFKSNILPFKNSEALPIISFSSAILQYISLSFLINPIKI